MADSVKVKGLREFIRACDASDKRTKRLVRNKLREVGRIVADDARGLFSVYDGGSAAGFRPIVRRKGTVTVEQTRRRVTGKRPDYGSLQMRRALLPAVEENEAEIVAKFEQAMDEIVAKF